MSSKYKIALRYIKYSGIWVGLVVNPYHWEFRYQTKSKEFPDSDHMFDNCIYCGPIWIRVIIDDGYW